MPAVQPQVPKFFGGFPSCALNRGSRDSERVPRRGEWKLGSDPADFARIAVLPCYVPLIEWERAEVPADADPRKLERSADPRGGVRDG